MSNPLRKCLHWFFKWSYAIAYREVNDNKEHFNEKNRFHVIEPTLHTWYADPFPFIDGEKRYIFAELCDDKNCERGTIGVMDLDKGESFTEIINEPFHMSYPNVFKYADDFYMIPETGASKSLRLYKAKEFPYKWELASILKGNIEIVDTSLLYKDEKIYAIGQLMNEQKNVMFELNLNNYSVRECELEGDYLDKRPGGNFTVLEDGIYHALQECGNVYGEYLHICKLDSFDGKVLNEKEIKEFHVSDMILDSKRPYRRVHTYNKVGNLEVYDLMYYQFNPTIIPEKIRRAFLKK